jgi:acetyl esterase/lipase
VTAYNFDSELRPYLDALPTVGAVDLEASRAAVREMAEVFMQSADTSGLDVSDRTIPGMDGEPDVTVRVYSPVGSDVQTARGAAIYIHGGGFTVGSIDLEHAHAAAIANGIGIVVVSVEYRLAPEHPYPAALHDCYAALTWVHSQCEMLAVDPARIAVIGNSAGGGLAAALALLARDRSGPAICFQYLGIPEIDDRLETPSMQRFVDTPMWTRAQAERSWSMYLGDLRGGDVPAHAAPARATDLTGLPPAYVSTMENDPLRDEGILYALGLLHAGVSVELHSFPGTWHGCRSLPSAVTKRDNEEMLAVLRAALNR